MKSLPGWTSRIDETSNGVYWVTFTDSFGRIAEVHGSDGIQKSIDKAIGYAFDIEKKISTNWSRFLYALCLLEIGDPLITNKNYYKVSGSWILEVKEKRILYESKNRWVISQIKKGTDWFDGCILKEDELTYNLYISLIGSIK